MHLAECKECISAIVSIAIVCLVGLCTPVWAGISLNNITFPASYSREACVRACMHACIAFAAHWKRVAALWGYVALVVLGKALAALYPFA